MIAQLTSKDTPVTLNKPCGQITINNESLAANGLVMFILFNSNITSKDSKDSIEITIDGGSMTLGHGLYDSVDQIIGREYVQEIKIIKLFDILSTSNILNSLKS